jgi:V8-like Glu-specific endopeptidase
MNVDIRSVVKNGGVWSQGNLNRPFPLAARTVAPDFEIILPDVPNRIDVPAPTRSPWQGVALLNFFKQNNLVGVGSGFLCQGDVIVTAKHNLTGARYDAAGIWMAFDAQTNPHVAPLVPRAFATHRSLDLAIFILPSPQPGSFQLGGVLPPANSEVTLAGYALPYADGTVRFSYATGSLVQAVGAGALAYMISTREGDSGAPVFVVSQGTPHAVGVHAEAALQKGNSGIHLNGAVVQDISKMIAWARSQIGGNQ